MIEDCEADFLIDTFPHSPHCPYSVPARPPAPPGLTPEYPRSGCRGQAARFSQHHNGGGNKTRPHYRALCPVGRGQACSRSGSSPGPLCPDCSRAAPDPCSHITLLPESRAPTIRFPSRRRTLPLHTPCADFAWIRAKTTRRMTPTIAFLGCPHNPVPENFLVKLTTPPVRPGR